MFLQSLVFMGLLPAVFSKPVSLEAEASRSVNVVITKIDFFFQKSHSSSSSTSDTSTFGVAKLIWPTSTNLLTARQAPAATGQSDSASESVDTHYSPFWNVTTPPHVPRRADDDDDEEEENEYEDENDKISDRSLKRPLGINCRGKHYCTFDLINNKHLSSTLMHIIENVPDDRIFGHKELIACARGISYLVGSQGYLCAWFNYGSNQDTKYWEHRSEMVSGRHAKILAKDIIMHNCKRCGSVPIEWPDSNDGSQGYLTFNARHQGCPGEIYEVDAICATVGNVAHGVLVGSEVDDTKNGTNDADATINDTEVV
ncbi:hypothetical protein ABW20_dc0103195 [Dactylellina cionopaga]|nr:hypothetical protein ABW20_dc0103195 [Dactylellina cionopaga]